MKKFVVVQGAFALGLVTALFASIPLARGDAKSATISVDEIKDGMKGYGLTVFKGTEPEKFDVEVVGVLHNFRPSQALILINTHHPRLMITKNVRGMSGSPIYLDGGRLAGAYAYSWAQFQTEPIAGVTPIAPMLTELHRPIPPGFWPLEGGAPLPRGKETAPARGEKRATLTPNTFDGAPGEYDLNAHAKEIAARFAPDPARPLVPSSTPIMMGGMGDRTAAYMRTIFEPLGLDPMQGGGGGSNWQDPNAPQHFVDGGTLGVTFARGDVAMFGLGTVTHVEGAKAVGFGHPMFEAGNLAFPTAIARVLWIFASEQHSSKIGEAIRPLGALVQDRQSSVVLDESKVAPTFPIHVDIKGVVGAPKLIWDSEVAEDKFVTPGVAAGVIGSAIEATANERRDVTWKLTSKLKIRGHGEIALEDFGVAVGGMIDSSDVAATRIVRAVGDVMNNPWEDTHIDGVETTLTVEYQRDLYRMRGAELLDAVVDAGQTARVRVKLFPLHGPDTSRVLEIRVPEELAGKDVEVEILPGYAIAPDVASPESLNELLANETRQSLAPRSLVAQIKVSQGVVFRAHVAERLPVFAMDALRPIGSDTGPDAITSYARTVFPIDKYVDGHEKVKIHVRPIVR